MPTPTPLEYTEPQSLMPNYESEFYVSEDLITDNPTWTPVMGVTNLDNNFDPVTLTRAYYNDGGAQREFPIGFKYMISVTGDRDLNDAGQNILFAAARIFATGSARQIRVKQRTAEFEITGICNQGYGIAKNGEALELATFDLEFGFQGKPTVDVV